jgi:hypothetical protein
VLFNIDQTTVVLSCIIKTNVTRNRAFKKAGNVSITLAFVRIIQFIYFSARHIILIEAVSITLPFFKKPLLT